MDMPYDRFKTKFENIAQAKLKTLELDAGTSVYRITTNRYGATNPIYFGGFTAENRFTFDDNGESFAYVALSPLTAVFEALLRESAFSDAHKHQKQNCLYYISPKHLGYIGELGKRVEIVVQKLHFKQDLTLVALIGAGIPLAGVDGSVVGRTLENLDYCSNAAKAIHGIEVPQYDGIVYSSALLSDDNRSPLYNGNICLFGSRTKNKIAVSEEYAAHSKKGSEYLLEAMGDLANQCNWLDNKFRLVRFGPDEPFI